MHEVNNKHLEVIETKWAQLLRKRVLPRKLQSDNALAAACSRAHQSWYKRFFLQNVFHRVCINCVILLVDDLSSSLDHASQLVISTRESLSLGHIKLLAKVMNSRYWYQAPRAKTVASVANASESNSTFH